VYTSNDRNGRAVTRAAYVGQRELQATVAVLGGDHAPLDVSSHTSD